MSCCFVSEPTEPAWPLVISVFISAVLMAFSIIIISIVAKKMLQKRKKKEEQPITKTPIIRTPTGIIHYPNHIA